MRLLCTISESTEENPYAFSYYLAGQGIENECEEVKEEGAALYRIWIYDEDKVAEAQELYRNYRENPKDPQFKTTITRLRPKVEAPAPLAEEESAPPKKRRLLSPAPYGAITVFVLLAAIVLFITAQIQRKNVLPPRIKGLIQAPLLSPIEKTLIFDYPYYFILRDQFLTLYTPQDISENKAPSAEALKLIQEIWKTPVWMGLYDKILVRFRNPNASIAFNAPLFEKIKQGEIWRFFTPALLHYDLLHIFFNLIWLILLGNQIEFRLGTARYLFLILATAIISNICQYLISGSFFMGLSGIVVGMAAFIWARQQKAPWEGYLLNRFTLIFLGIFVFGMFLLQIVLFFLQVYGKMEFPLSIANTAHLTGGAVGYLLGCSRLFAIRHKVKK